jgi:hypothetical protein
MEKDRTTWFDVAVDFGSQVTERWVGALERYSAPYAGYVQLLASSPWSKSLMATLVARSYQSNRDQFVLPRPEPEGLHFVFDEVAESAGPRSIALPHPSWATKLPKLTDVKLPDGKGASPLGTNNVMTRVEGGRLTVTLVGLNDALAAGKAGASRSKAAFGKQTGGGAATNGGGAKRNRYGQFHLVFENHRDPIPVSTAAPK